MATMMMFEPLIARNPATEAELGRVPTTPPGRVAEVMARAGGRRRAGPIGAGASVGQPSSVGGVC